MKPPILNLAVQKSGRLNGDSIELLEECGLAIIRSENKLKSPVRNFPLELLFLRDDDIPEYVADGVADIGIVGENLLAEQERPIRVLQKLGFGRCRLSIAVPEGFDYQGAESLNGLRVATSYPDILKRFLDEKGVQAEIREISGSAEIAPSIGLAEAVCDLVSSGSTLMSTRLKEVEVVMESQAVLVAGNNLDEEKQKIVERLIMRIRSAQEAKSCRYVSLNAPTERIAELAQILPGMRSPTIVPLAEPGWSAMHSVIADCDFWELIEQLKDAGAEGILVLPIEKMFLSSDSRVARDTNVGLS